MLNENLDKKFSQKCDRRFSKTPEPKNTGLLIIIAF